MSFRVNHGHLYPLEKIGGKNEKSKKNNELPNSFGEILRNKVHNSEEKIKISAHAMKRLEERNIPLNENDLKTLQKAVDQAQAKGAKESLILYRNMAFITSIQNRTIITAMDQESAKENVFTNIDSAMIID